jgi:acyl-CoA thioesterase YciA
MKELDTPKPEGALALQTVAMPCNTNANGDIFAGWLVTQMDLSASIEAMNICRGRVATVSMDRMRFLHSVHVGAVVSCYTHVIEVGRSSMRIHVDVWIDSENTFDPIKVTDGEFVLVLLDSAGQTRAINA